MHDLAVRGGMVFDGLGSDPVRADVAVRNGVVVEIGHVTDSAARTIDAEDRFVVPGFVDGHTHLDAQVFWDPLCGSLLAHGVTTAIMGNCGFTLAPGSEQDFDLILRSIERAEDMSREAISAGVPWSWTTFPEFLDAVASTPKALNIGAQIGHSALRASVMGERAFSDPATDEDLDAMQAAVHAAISAGAIGFTTSRSRSHLTYGDTPVASRSASWEEVVCLVMVMQELGAGIFQLAPERPSDPALLADFQTRLGELAVRSGRPVTFMIGDQEEQLRTVDHVAARGATIAGQVHVRRFENVYGFKTTLPFDQLPAWRQLRAQPLEEQRRLLHDANVVNALVEAVQHGSYDEGIGAEVRAPQLGEITVVDGSDAEPALTELAQSRGTHPIELLIDLSVATGFQQLFRQPITRATSDAVLAALRHPNTVVAASDSGAHVSQLLDSNIPTYLLSHWVRDRGAFPWQEAIRMLTSRPAQVWGLTGRGTLREGSHADLVVFDPRTVATDTPVVVDDLPDGGPRLAQGAIGVHAVLVAGEPVMLEGLPTGATPGRLLRGGVG